MSAITYNAVSVIGRAIQYNASLLRVPTSTATTCLEILRHRTTKHWNPKFKKERKAKVIKIKLPHEEPPLSEMTPEEIRTKMKERGLVRPRPWTEKPVYISCSGAIIEPYVPPEGDGKFSAISTTGAKQNIEFIKKKGTSMLAVRKMRNYEEDLNLKEFAEIARDIYIKAHEALARRNKIELRQYVTERAYPEMIHNTHDKIVHWKFVQSLEPGRVVHARYSDAISGENVFGQLTVRFHTQQVLAIYDRFGRLLHGSEFITKDVLEYIVFEKQLSNEYGVWRLHDKIIPPWMPAKEPFAKTFVVKNVDPVLPEKESQAKA